jgi:hypothetical protein
MKIEAANRIQATERRVNGWLWKPDAHTKAKSLANAVLLVSADKEMRNLASNILSNGIYDTKAELSIALKKLGRELTKSIKPMVGDILTSLKDSK